MQKMNKEGVDFSLVTLDYLWNVLSNIPSSDSGSSIVRFGILGYGKHPNYQVETAAKDAKTYMGSNHKRDTSETRYEEEHLTRAYPYEEIHQCFDVALKSEAVASQYLWEYWKANRKRYPNELTSAQKASVLKAIMNGASLKQTVDALFIS